ncbi:8203_t:CDS:2, partial [Cetraspora pellucida]
KDTKLDKASNRLIEYFNLLTNAMICNHCKYISDIDRSYQNYPYPSRFTKEEFVRIHDRIYAFRSEVLYTEDQYKELEKAYHEICEELKEAKLESDDTEDSTDERDDDKKIMIDTSVDNDLNS